MQLYILDKGPQLAAKYHCRNHKPKMLMEALQLYSTYLIKKGYNEKFFYKSVNQGKEVYINKSYVKRKIKF